MTGRTVCGLCGGERERKGRDRDEEEEERVIKDRERSNVQCYVIIHRL